MLARLKEKWEELGILMKPDKDIMRAMKEVKAKYDKEKLKTNPVLSEERKAVLVDSLTNTTLNLAGKDWKQELNA